MKSYFKTYEWVAILFYLIILTIGLYAGYKSGWKPCDDPQCCDGTPMEPVTEWFWNE